MMKPRKAQKLVDLPAVDLTDMNPEARRDIYSLAGKEIASSIGSRLLFQMLSASELSIQELSEKSGFDASVLFDIVSGKLPAGPDLWTLVALGEAMELDVDVSFSKR